MNEYFTANGILGLGALFNQVYSDRSDGKTFDIKYRGCQRFEKYGHVTVYMRRWKTEFTSVMIDTFLNEVQRVYPKFKTWDFRADKSGIQVKKDGYWKYAFYFIPLSVGNKLKSNIDPTDIREIDFDEYVPLDGRYCKDEMINLLEFWNSCDRQRGIVKLCTFGNKITGSNPFLNFFGVDLDLTQPKTRLYKDGQLAIQVYMNDIRRDTMAKNPFMKLVEGTIYEGYMKGDILCGSLSNIKPKPENADLWSSFKTVNGEGTIWTYKDKWFISDKQNNDVKFCVTDKPYMQDFKTELVASNVDIANLFRNVYRNSLMCFTSEKAFNLFEPIIKLITLR